MNLTVHSSQLSALAKAQVAVGDPYIPLASHAWYVAHICTCCLLSLPHHCDLLSQVSRGGCTLIPRLVHSLQQHALVLFPYSWW